MILPPFSTCTCCLSQHASHSQYTGATWSSVSGKCLYFSLSCTFLSFFQFSHLVSLLAKSVPRLTQSIPQDEGWTSFLREVTWSIVFAWFYNFFLCTCCLSQHTSHSQCTGATWSTEIPRENYFPEESAFISLYSARFKPLTIFLPCGRMETFSQGSDLIYILFSHDFTTFFQHVHAVWASIQVTPNIQVLPGQLQKEFFFLRKVPWFLSILHIFKLPIFPPC